MAWRRVCIASVCAAMIVIPIPAAAQDSDDVRFHAVFPGRPDGDALACDARGTSYEPLAAGQTLQLRDNSGAGVGFGVLEAVVPPSREGMCETSVVFAEVPHGPVYFVIAGDRVVATRERPELEASDWVMTSMYGTPLDTAAPAPAGSSSLDPVAQLYLAVMNKWNARGEELNRSLERAWDSDDVEQRAQAWLESARHDEERLVDVLAIQYPPEVQVSVDRLAETTEELVTTERLLAGAPFDDARYRRFEEADLANAEAYVEMRRVLGLPAIVAEAEPSAAPVPETVRTYRVDEWVTVSDYGEPELRVKVLDVRQDPYFQLDYGRDRPGNGLIYLSVLLRYEALANGADYNPYDWQIFVGDEAYGGQAFTMGGPEPELGSGNLPKGRKAKGWVTFEVPPTGRVLLTYQSGFSFDDSAPPFEIIVRAR